MRPSRLSYCFLGTFLIVLFAVRWFQHLNVWLTLPILLGASLISIALAYGERKFQRAWSCSAALILGSVLALWSVARTTHVPTVLSIDTYAESTYVTIRGTIAAEPDRRPLSTKYTIAAKEIQQSDGTIIFPVSGLVLATDRRQWPEYRFGQRVTARGVLENPGQIEEFEYDKYLSRYGIYAVMYSASVHSDDDIVPPSFFGLMYGIKERFEAQINRL
ncbi:MAG TPA: ComEC/Rec2 family competence protein, partial [Candidatus Peribacteraceae bacterium]|nr:ComEC/Rec2 family competence protein [Candidatus Peribacteraceae bacterium]